MSDHTDEQIEAASFAMVSLYRPGYPLDWTAFARAALIAAAKAAPQPDPSCWRSPEEQAAVDQAQIAARRANEPAAAPQAAPDEPVTGCWDAFRLAYGLLWMMPGTDRARRADDLACTARAALLAHMSRKDQAWGIAAARKAYDLFAAPPAVTEAIETYFARQIEWSKQTFGPDLRTGGVIDHIRKELCEIEAEPHDLSEWIDVVILAMDGYWRHGGAAEGLMPMLLVKQRKNMARTWPDWRTMSTEKAIEHDRTADAAVAALAEGEQG